MARYLTVRELIAELSMQREDDIVVIKHDYADQYPWALKYEDPSKLFLNKYYEPNDGYLIPGDAPIEDIPPSALHALVINAEESF
jgi:hypothetical protein